MSWGGRANPRATKSASRQFDVLWSFTAKFAVKPSGGSPKKKATSIRCTRPIAAVIRRFLNKSFEREPSMKPVGTPFPAVCKNRQKPMLPTTSVADMSSRRGEGTKGKWRGWLALHPSRLRRSISAETNAWFSTEQLASSVSGPATPPRHDENQHSPDGQCSAPTARSIGKFTGNCQWNNVYFNPPSAQVQRNFGICMTYSARSNERSRHAAGPLVKRQCMPSELVS